MGIPDPQCGTQKSPLFWSDWRWTNQGTTTSSVSFDEIYSIFHIKQIKRSNVERAIKFLEEIVGDFQYKNHDELIRKAEMMTHPDHGGDAKMFIKVQEARKLIKTMPPARQPGS